MARALVYGVMDSSSILVLFIDSPPPLPYSSYIILGKFSKLGAGFGYIALLFSNALRE